MVLSSKNSALFSDVFRVFYAHNLPQFPPNYRTQCSRRFPSGRLSRRGRIRAIKKLQESAYIYKTMSGRSGWPSRDPINEFGFKSLTHHPGLFNRKEESNLYRFVANDSIQSFDVEGLWVVCRRDVRVAPGESWVYGLFAHTDIREDCSKCDSGSTCYPIIRDPKCNKCPHPDPDQCLKDNPYSAGNGTWGDNCQSNTRDRLKKCCLKAPTWWPDFYAYPPPQPILPF